MYGVRCLFACHEWEVLSTLTYKTPTPMKFVVFTPQPFYALRNISYQ